MKSFFVVLFVFILTANVVESKNPTVGTKQCDVESFKEAQERFATKIGLPSADNWQNPLELFKGIQKYYAENPHTGLVDVCK